MQENEEKKEIIETEETKEKKRGNPNIGNLIKEKSPEEQIMIREQAARTRHENAVKKHKMQQELAALLSAKVKVKDEDTGKMKVITAEEKMLKNVVEIALDKYDKRCLQAVDKVLEISGIDFNEDKKNAQINIEGQQIQIVFEGEIGKYSK